jgi:hypothetical protein
LDFADLNETFFDNALVVPSHNKSKRWVAIGVNIRGVVVVVIHAARPRRREPTKPETLANGLKADFAACLKRARSDIARLLEMKEPPTRTP